jgi:hypothetical protein
MEFKVGDIVYCEDPELKENCPDVWGFTAVVYGLGINYCGEVVNYNYIRLRFINFEYYGGEYHGALASCCFKTNNLLLKELC